MSVDNRRKRAFSGRQNQIGSDFSAVGTDRFASSPHGRRVRQVHKLRSMPLLHAELPHIQRQILFIVPMPQEFGADLRGGRQGSRQEHPEETSGEPFSNHHASAPSHLPPLLIPLDCLPGIPPNSTHRPLRRAAARSGSHPKPPRENKSLGVNTSDLRLP